MGVLPSLTPTASRRRFLIPPMTAKTPAVVGVVGVVGTSTNSKTQASPGTPTLRMPVANDLVWDEDAHAADNYAALGKQLAKNDRLFRGPEYA